MSTQTAATGSSRPERRPRGAGGPAAPRRGRGRGGVLARVALVPALTCYGIAVVTAGLVAVLATGADPPVGAPGSLSAPGSGLTPALGAGIPLWLAAHLVPLQISGVPLGVLPLAPALALAVMVARVARSAARRLGGGPTTAGAPVVATATAAHAVMAVLAASLLTPETVVDASPGSAGVVAGLLAAVASLAGVAGPCGVGAALPRLPSWARDGLRWGLLAAATLLCAGATLLLAALVADADAVAAVIGATAPQAGSGAGLTLLCVLYLPNAVVAATSWVAGPGVTLGLAAASPTAVVTLPAAVPPFPLLAVLPTAPPPSWAALTFAIPLAVGSAVGWFLAPTSSDPYRRLRALLVAGLVAATLLGVLAALAGGRAGQGPIDPVVVPAAALAAAVLGWVTVPGAVVTVLAVPAGPSASRTRTRSRGTGATARSRGGDARRGEPADGTVEDAGTDAEPEPEPEIAAEVTTTSTDRPV